MSTRILYSGGKEPLELLEASDKQKLFSHPMERSRQDSLAAETARDSIQYRC